MLGLLYILNNKIEVTKYKEIIIKELIRNRIIKIKKNVNII